MQSHRSLGPAMQLVRQSVDCVLSQLRMGYSFPNKKATPVFKRTQIEQLGRIVRYSCVVRSKKHLQERLPKLVVPLASFVLDVYLSLRSRIKLLSVGTGLRCAWHDGFSEAFDTLWQLTKKEGLALTVRDRATLEWRHKQSPGADNNRLFVIEDTNNQLLGYTVCSLDDGVLSVDGFFYNGQERVLQALLLELLPVARDLGAQSVTLGFYGSEKVVSELGKAGFLPREERPLFVSVPTLSKEELADLNCHVTCSDEDD